MNSEYRASVTAVKDHLAVNLYGERVFISLPIVMPVITLIALLIYIHGAHIYIRNKVKDPKQFPTIAALYWIGQTFSVYVIIMDILALKASHPHNRIFSTLLYFIIPIEILSLLLSLVIVLISTFSGVVNCQSKIYNRGILISQKETKIWSCISGFISPLICVSSHIGFVIGGWISFGERSISILLFYLFVFLILYWCLRQSYRVSVFLVDKYQKRKYGIQASKHAKEPEVYENSEETNLTSLPRNRLRSDSEAQRVEEEKLFNDFNQTALIIMIIAGILLDIMLFYFGFGMLSLLKFFDDAVINVYTLVQYVVYFAVFLLTYGQFTNAPNSRPNISTKTLQLWRYLCSEKTPKYSIESLQHVVKHLISMLEVLEKASYSVRPTALFNPKAKYHFVEATKACACVATAPNDESASQSQNIIDETAEKLKEAMEVSTENSTDSHITKIKVQVKCAKEKLQKMESAEVLSESANKAVMHLTKGVNILQNEAIKLLHSYNDLGIYNSRDKIEALRAALIFQKTSTFEHLEDNENLSLLMSLIET